MQLLRCFVLILLAIAGQSFRHEEQLGRMGMNNDFEASTSEPWMEESPGSMSWKVENYTTPWEPSSPCPKPRKGRNILRAVRDASYKGGMVVLRSPEFTVSPGDSVSFAFWLRSNQTGGTNLELYWVQNNRETLMTKLDQFSTDTNFEWRTTSAMFPVSSPTQVSLVFYGFLGNQIGDAVGIDDVAISSTIATPSGCNEILTSSSGSFASPNYPSNYPDNTYCSWIIVTDESIRSSVSFSSIRTENISDILTVYDGPTQWAPVLARYTGSYNTMPQPITANTNMMLITFESDTSVTDTGFSASFTTQPAIVTTTPSTPTPPKPCGEQFTGTGTIQSPNYPELYPRLLDCYWYLQSSASKYISLQFSDFSLENIYDWVTVYEGWSTTGATLLFRYSGREPPRSIETANTNQMLVHFHTDNLTTIFSSGFEAFFSSIQIPPVPPMPPSTPECTLTLMGQSGTFESPNYPSFYNNHLNCKWTIKVDWPYRVQVTFSAIYTADNNDIVTVFDGDSTSSPIIAQTGGSAAPISPRSTGQALVVTFITDSTGTTSGWRATYTII